VEGSVACKTISLPFVEGDIDGRLTAQIIKAITTETRLRYIPSGGDLTLHAKIVEKERTHIGYKYDQQEITGALINRLIPDEGRRRIIVELSLFEGERELIESMQVSAESDYDFVNSDTVDDLSFVNDSGERQSILTFSLGQLDAWEGASDVALNVAFDRLAKKIVDGIRRL
jgi:hypothetical protein